ncbi:endoglucanase A-like [Saccoglossus kowalevskii]|uniref:Endoglucanase n=1 Tax=Saccoglossus kowalevskii TaxID=10224 RepID=A0ABM0GRK0_SACKO|nr:PREDICTED: endoglucanase-like [Saccoglossus kowalevskii]
MRQIAKQYDYGEVLHKSILFFEVQRSGYLEKNRVPYRSHSAMDDKGRAGEDLTGGWYDAGDHMKFALPMASSTTNLAWGMLMYKEAYEHLQIWDEALIQLKWPLDYFIKCHVTREEFYFQVGDGDLDHAYWGRPEQMDMARPSYKVDRDTPGSDVAGETAAAMAAGSAIFQESDPEYASTLLQHAKELFEFAMTYRGTYPNMGFYGSSNYGDELALAACFLYIATSDSVYLNEAEKLYKEFNLHELPWSYSWDEKKPAVQLLLTILTGNSGYQTDFTSFLNEWLPGGGVPYTPKGLVYRDQWGPLRYAANAAMLGLIAADYGIRQSAYRDFAYSQINYMLGDTGRSYVVGFGNSPPERPHHRSSSCPDYPAKCDWAQHSSPSPNPQTAYGALIGGPDINDNFVDDRTDFRSNEVACDYNAGFQSAIAGMVVLDINGKLP